MYRRGLIPLTLVFPFFPSPRNLVSRNLSRLLFTNFVSSEYADRYSSLYFVPSVPRTTRPLPLSLSLSVPHTTHTSPLSLLFIVTVEPWVPIDPRPYSRLRNLRSQPSTCPAAPPFSRSVKQIISCLRMATVTFEFLPINTVGESHRHSVPTLPLTTSSPSSMTMPLGGDTTVSSAAAFRGPSRPISPEPTGPTHG